MPVRATRTTTRALGAAILVAGLSAAGVSPAAAADTTPPVLNTPIKSSFLVGSQLGTEYPSWCGHVTGDGQLFLGVQQTFKWSATDASGSITYSYVEDNPGFGPGDPVYIYKDTSLTSFTSNTTNNCVGGPNDMVSGWFITATDGSGNATTKAVRGARFTLTQQNNVHDDAFYAQSPRITYSAGWSSASCACWSDGGVTKTSTKNASASMAITASAADPAHVGLVMHKGPDRGKFQVLIDGKLNATVDLYSASNLPKTIVWQAAIQKNSTIKIVNLATAGRTRIDLDAVLTN